MLARIKNIFFCADMDSSFYPADIDSKKIISNHIDSLKNELYRTEADISSLVNRLMASETKKRFLDGEIAKFEKLYKGVEQ